MEIINIKENNNIIRVRKEEEGCGIFTQSLFVEGDDLTFLILKLFKENGVASGVKYLLNEYAIEEKLLKNDLLSLFHNFAENNILNQMSSEVFDYFGENYK